jgi:alcohol dehydrogenase (cytochrome c)
VDVERAGKTVPALVHAGRNGYLWTLERHDDGKIGFIDGKPFVNQNVFTGLDPKTGRPSYDPTKIPGTNKKLAFCPGLWGGKDWPPEAYNPKTGMLYIPANDNLCSELGGVPITGRAAGELYIGVTIDEILSSLRFRDGVDASKPVDIGEVQAWDLKTGKKAWTHTFQDSANWGPLLTTGGDLVFGGGTSDRKFRAFDAKSGKVVWETRLNSGVTGVPSTYMVDGVQYIAVQAGWGVDAERMMGGISTLLPEDRRPPKMTQGGVIWVFALGKDQTKQQAAAQ